MATVTRNDNGGDFTLTVSPSDVGLMQLALYALATWDVPIIDGEDEVFFIKPESRARLNVLTKELFEQADVLLTDEERADGN